MSQIDLGSLQQRVLRSVYELMSKDVKSPDFFERVLLDKCGFCLLINFQHSVKLD